MPEKILNVEKGMLWKKNKGTFFLFLTLSMVFYFLCVVGAGLGTLSVYFDLVFFILGIVISFYTLFLNTKPSTSQFSAAASMFYLASCFGVAYFTSIYAKQSSNISLGMYDIEGLIIAIVGILIVVLFVLNTLRIYDFHYVKSFLEKAGYIDYQSRKINTSAKFSIPQVLSKQGEQHDKAWKSLAYFLIKSKLIWIGLIFQFYPIIYRNNLPMQARYSALGGFLMMLFFAYVGVFALIMGITMRRIEKETSIKFQIIEK